MPTAGIDAQVISKDETTFQFQDVVAPLPVPNLDNTLSKYLDSGEHPAVVNYSIQLVSFYLITVLLLTSSFIADSLLYHGLIEWLVDGLVGWLVGGLGQYIKLFPMELRPKQTVWPGFPLFNYGYDW